jgi:tRNA threonylcarbamoyl adenosine modification protein (Sua5/YciO/YrdC/YwlC family)
VRELVARLEAGLVVAVATESFFGLLADATSRAALDVLLRVKPRGADKGIPLILPSANAWDLLVADVPPAARALAAALWPGALSIALAARPELDRRVTLDGSVAVRVPGSSPAAELARLFGKPLTATSANLPGEPPATDETEVVRQLGQAVASGLLHVVPGKSPGGSPSTLVDVGRDRARIVREGRVPRATVAAVLANAGARLDEAGPPS